MQTFEKWGASIRDFTKGGMRLLRKLKILRSKLGVSTQFLVKNCMTLKYALLGGGGCANAPPHPPAYRPLLIAVDIAEQQVLSLT